MIQDPYQLFVVFLGVVLLAVELDRRYAVVRKISPVVLILFLGGLLSNIGLITTDSPLYGAVIDFTVPFAVCLILFTVRLSDLKAVGLPLLAAFALACVGTFLGALAANLSLSPYLATILGDDAWKLAGPFTGTYIGGSLNFFALWEGLEIGNPDLLAAANAVDNLSLFVLFAIWIFIPDVLGRFFPVARLWKTPAPPTGEKRGSAPTQLRVRDVVALSFAAMVVILVSNLLNEHYFARFFPNLPTILIITTLALVIAQFRFIHRFEGANEISTLAFYLFFCAVGAMINIKMAVMLSPVLFAYVMIMVIVHMVTVYGGGRLLRMDIRLLTMASAATKTGPPSVIALANAKDWKDLALPGVAVGLLGYAIGNYFGFAAAYLVRYLAGP